jgi:hypothetical protein
MRARMMMAGVVVDSLVAMDAFGWNSSKLPQVTGAVTYPVKFLNWIEKWQVTNAVTWVRDLPLQNLPVKTVYPGNLSNLSRKVFQSLNRTKVSSHRCSNQGMTLVSYRAKFFRWIELNWSEMTRHMCNNLSNLSRRVFFLIYWIELDRTEVTSHMLSNLSYASFCFCFWI